MSTLVGSSSSGSVAKGLLNTDKLSTFRWRGQELGGGPSAYRACAPLLSYRPSMASRGQVASLRGIDLYQRPQTHADIWIPSLLQAKALKQPSSKMDTVWILTEVFY